MSDITIKVPPISEPAACRCCGRVFQLVDPRQRALQAERDKLAGLLREVGDWIERTSFHGTDAVDLMQRIDAALAEVKPCAESPHPAAT